MGSQIFAFNKLGKKYIGMYWNARCISAALGLEVGIWPAGLEGNGEET